MIDLILIAVFAGLFYTGFRCGNKFSTLKLLGAAGIARISGWFRG